MTKINLDTLSEICAALSCDMAYLVAGTATGESAYLQDELISKYSALTQTQKKITLDFMDILIKVCSDKN